MDKLYAIQRADGTIMPDAISGTRKMAWLYAAEWENFDDYRNEVTLTNDEIGESLGYRCVEVEVVKAREGER